ncbi:MAG: N-acetylmuramoyl-L-alanine amidase, N-acetylmuramoyl-L-alanine amidase [Candidatus Peregrinibacteria bacterium GW2011_GWC2_39_14]|nr:MAG: Cellulosome-anchoring protein [Candidatus Peregrinibacteria bacterium GW2011_GWA2_38_36]KKR04967.1 MAG: N-acetylmuramoyl-L-alanine amidase, N-acetylmuramoyl-L-alanine amidase [Candidatus Peregrinibacteria bacterium GW2011_GWC2_39_14]
MYKTKRFVSFSLSLILVLTAIMAFPFNTALAGAMQTGSGTVKIEPCLNLNLLSGKNLDSCIDIYDSSDNRIYIAFPKTNAVFDNLKNGATVKFTFSITGGEEYTINGKTYNTYLITDVAAPAIIDTDEKVAIPPAGFEDEVITSFVNYKNPFIDTDITSIEGKAAAELYRRAVIGGYADGEFKGNKSVNRAETAKFLLLARFGEIKEDLKNNGKFHDVLDNQWYTRFVVKAAEKGIINGNPDGTFRPESTVNAAEFLKMLALTFTVAENIPYDYKDVSPNDWFAKYAGIAKKFNLFPERTDFLYPTSPLSRKDIAVALYMFLASK